MCACRNTRAVDTGVLAAADVAAVVVVGRGCYHGVTGGVCAISLALACQGWGHHQGTRQEVGWCLLLWCRGVGLVVVLVVVLSGGACLWAPVGCHAHHCLAGNCGLLCSHSCAQAALPQGRSLQRQAVTNNMRGLQEECWDSPGPCVCQQQHLCTMHAWCGVAARRLCGVAGDYVMILWLLYLRPCRDQGSPHDRSCHLIGVAITVQTLVPTISVPTRLLGASFPDRHCLYMSKPVLIYE